MPKRGGRGVCMAMGGACGWRWEGRVDGGGRGVWMAMGEELERIRWKGGEGYRGEEEREMEWKRKSRERKREERGGGGRERDN